MPVLLPLSQDQERRLEAAANRREREEVQKILNEAVDVVVAELIDDQRPFKTVPLLGAKGVGKTRYRAADSEDRFARLDALAQRFSDLPELSDYALSRESIYDRSLG